MEEKITCPQCDNPGCEADHEYCWNCGCALQNYCDNQECSQLGQSDEDDDVVVLPRHYVHCPYCGELSRLGRTGHIQEAVFPL